MDLSGLTFDDVILKPQKGVLYSRKDADISVPSLGIDVPFVSAPMPSVASPRLLREITRLGGLGVVHRMNRSEHDIGASWATCHNNKIAAAIGLNTDVVWLFELGVRKFVFDVAHAHMDQALELLTDFKGRYEDEIFLIAGNVATSDGAIALEQAGADAIKVGIGPGSVCTTRQVTGFGVPQLEAIQETSSSVSIPVIADGGIRNSGDCVKALAAGASAVMIGSLFAHSVEAETDSHYGCASHQMNGHNAPEGMSVTITVEPEPLETIVKRLTWGIRSGISYGGATNIQELQENAEWIQLTDAGRKESKL